MDVNRMVKKEDRSESKIMDTYCIRLDLQNTVALLSSVAHTFQLLIPTSGVPEGASVTSALPATPFKVVPLIDPQFVGQVVKVQVAGLPALPVNVFVAVVLPI